MATSAPARTPRATTAEAVVGAAFGLGALALAAEAAVHIQQYFAVVHGVHVVGPLFLANAAACLATIVGLGSPRSRQLAALAGITISALALASLVVSYGRGLWGFFEVGFRAAIPVAIVAETAAIILLAVALALDRDVSLGRDRERTE